MCSSIWETVGHFTYYGWHLGPVWSSHKGALGEAWCVDSVNLTQYNVHMNILVTKHVEIKKITLLLKSVANNAGLNVKNAFNRSRMILCSSGDALSSLSCCHSTDYMYVFRFVYTSHPLNKWKKMYSLFWFYFCQIPLNIVARKVRIIHEHLLCGFSPDNGMILCLELTK